LNPSIEDKIKFMVEARWPELPQVAEEMAEWGLMLYQAGRLEVELNKLKFDAVTIRRLRWHWLNRLPKVVVDWLPDGVWVELDPPRIDYWKED